MRPIPDAAVDFVANHEGRRLVAYQDVAKVWTIGYGHTGPEVIAGRKIDNDEARLLLKGDLKTASSRLHVRVKREVIDELTENQYAALLSFVYNLGADPKWTIWKRLNARQFDQVPLELMKFVNSGGMKVQGLVNRRADEVKLWSLGEPGSSASPVPSHVTRTEATPPTAAEPKPLLAQNSFMATAGAAVLGAPAAIKQVSDQVAPFADKSHHVAHIVETLATAGAAAAVAAAFFLWLKSREAKR